MKSILMVLLLSTQLVYAGRNSTATQTQNESTTTPSQQEVVSPEIKPVELYEETDKASKRQKAYATYGSMIATGLAIKAGYCWSTCNAACSGKCVPWTLAAIGAAGVAAHNATSAGKNSNLANRFKSDGEYSDPTTEAGGTDGGGTGTTVAVLPDALRQLEQKAKVKINPKTGTVTTRDGKTYSQQDISSPGAMAAAGLSSNEMGKINSEIQKAKDEFAKKAADGGESGDILVGSKTSKGEEVPPNFDYAPTTDRLAASRDPAQVAGLSKNYNGELIGVSGDSIFGIIDRRYKFHNEKGSFLSGK